jgi:hypothetical protein
LLLYTVILGRSPLPESRLRILYLILCLLSAFVKAIVLLFYAVS